MGLECRLLVIDPDTDLTDTTLNLKESLLTSSSTQYSIHADQSVALLFVLSEITDHVEGSHGDSSHQQQHNHRVDWGLTSTFKVDDITQHGSTDLLPAAPAMPTRCNWSTPTPLDKLQFSHIFDYLSDHFEDDASKVMRNIKEVYTSRLRIPPLSSSHGAAGCLLLEAQARVAVCDCVLVERKASGTNAHVCNVRVSNSASAHALTCPTCELFVVKTTCSVAVETPLIVKSDLQKSTSGDLLIRVSITNTSRNIIKLFDIHVDVCQSLVGPVTGGGGGRITTEVTASTTRAKEAATSIDDAIQDLQVFSVPAAASVSALPLILVPGARYLALLALRDSFGIVPDSLMSDTGVLATAGLRMRTPVAVVWAYEIHNNNSTLRSGSIDAGGDDVVAEEENTYILWSTMKWLTSLACAGGTRSRNGGSSDLHAEYVSPEHIIIAGTQFSLQIQISNDSKHDMAITIVQQEGTPIDTHTPQLTQTQDPGQKNQSQGGLLLPIEASTHVGIVVAHSTVTASVTLWAVCSGSFDVGNLLVVRDAVSGLSCRLICASASKSTSRQIWIEPAGRRAVS